MKKKWILLALLSLVATARAELPFEIGDWAVSGGIAHLTQERDDGDDTGEVGFAAGGLEYFLSGNLSAGPLLAGGFTTDDWMVSVGGAVKLYEELVEGTVQFAGFQINYCRWDNQGDGWYYGPIVGTLIPINGSDNLFGTVSWEYQIWNGSDIDHSNLLVFGAMKRF